MSAPLHPMLVHFPAVLLPLAAGLSLAARRREGLRDASAIALYVATVSALLAVLAGLFDHEPYEHSAVATAIANHERLGFVTLSLAAIASSLRSIGRHLGRDPVTTTWFAALVLATVVSVVATGTGGGSLVYDEAVGVQKGAHVRGFRRTLR